MIAWTNFVVLAASTLMTYVLYVLSVQPAALERRIGPAAFPRCTRYRVLAGVFMTIACANYVVYYFHPLPVPLPRTFPGPYWVWVAAAAVIAIPSGYLFGRGVRDAGEETMRPRKEHALYGGIYGKIRHPQMAGELPFFWVFAFLLDSPFLALYSFVWVPIFLAFCLAEEKDLGLRYGAAYEEYRRRTGFFFPKGK
jgi:protein-S-isoprenylcysteine O-methyltransferase Ste14